MNKDQLQIRVNEIKEKLNKWREAYYLLDNPIVDDIVYDKLYNELVKIEKENPELITSDSPTQLVGDRTSSTFNKVEHKVKMLSLDNAFGDKDLDTFNKQVSQSVGDVDYFVEPKIDGISISLTYDNGEYVKAVTRGDGQVGEDVTENIKNLLNIPLSINYKLPIEIRGEVYIPLDTFEKINEERIKLGETLFANPRNTAAGAVRQLDPTIVKQRGLKVMVYWAYSLTEMDYAWETQSETINQLNKLGFEVSDLSNKWDSISGVKKHIEKFNKDRRTINYEIDGVVIKVNNTRLYDEIGNTSKFPKWAIAYKFPAEVKETTLLDIFPTVGRTGRITYNAVLEEVELAGTRVTAATLHNSEYIEELDLRIGDIVNVKKAGEIIPKVISANTSARKETLKVWKPASTCPTCETSLVKKEGEVDQYCPNEKCQSRILESLIHFTSRNAMNIEGLSDKQLERFINLGWIKDISDIYNLEQYKDELYKLDGYGDRSIKVLFESINKSKNATLDRLLFGLGIRHIGRKTARDISNSFKDIDSIAKATYDELMNESDLGEVKSKSIVEYFNNEDNMTLINKMIDRGLSIKEVSKIEIDTNSKLNGKTIVITGTIGGGNREEVKEFFERKGAKISNAVSSKTDYLICGEKPSENKVKKVEKSKIINIVDINSYKE